VATAEDDDAHEDEVAPKKYDEDERLYLEFGDIYTAKWQ
jgi:hypothetical protein